MKTSLLHLLALLCLLIAKSATAKANSPPMVLADTVTIQFSTGYGLDCNGFGRQCLAAQPITQGEMPAITAHGVARAWFNEQGRFVMEVRQVLNTQLWNELEAGSFYLDSSVPLPAAIMAALGKSGQLYTLPAGLHNAQKRPDSSYRITF